MNNPPKRIPFNNEENLIRQEEEAVQETGSVSSDSDPEVASEEEPEDMANE